jgi:putative lipoic acid-binding regulatory protein
MASDDSAAPGAWPADAAQAARLYPAEVPFRIVVVRDFAGEAALRQVLAAYEVTAPLAPGTVSAGGRYCAWRVSVRIRDRAEMLRIDRELRAVAGVRLLL